MDVPQKLNKIREEMKKENVQALIVPTSDFHFTEYVAPYFQARKYLSGFDGSQGVLVILPEEAGLFVDGRYFQQADQQLEGSGIKTMKIGQPGVPVMIDYVVENTEPNSTVAIDGRTITHSQFKNWSEKLNSKNLTLKTDVDFPGRIWQDRPDFPNAKTFFIEEEYSGKPIAKKLEEVRKQMEKLEAPYHFVSKIDEIAWLLNFRAQDIPSLPAALSYVLIGPDQTVLFIDQERLDERSRKEFEENGIEIRAYVDVYEVLNSIEEPILVDPDAVSELFYSTIKHPVEKTDPINLLKAVKNETEIEGARKAHIKDAVAMINFLHWLENNPETTEMGAADVLHQFRSEQPDFLEDSFTTISAYGPNASMPHYHPSRAKPVDLKPESFLLVDSGGHYLDGTTDITRTIVLGDLSEKEREMFTRVLQGHIDLARIHFPKGVNGAMLEVLARAPLWKNNLDFNHSTGHGVAYLTNVHEGPNMFRWSAIHQPEMMPGMITSNEPGYYEEGNFGIRHENLMLTVEDGDSAYGTFYRFEPLTLVPFDLKGLNIDLLTEEQLEWLNDYHRLVYDTISPLLDEQVRIWLEENTKPVERN